MKGRNNLPERGKRPRGQMDEGIRRYPLNAGRVPKLRRLDEAGDYVDSDSWSDGKERQAWLISPGLGAIAGGIFVSGAIGFIAISINLMDPESTPLAASVAEEVKQQHATAAEAVGATIRAYLRATRVEEKAAFVRHPRETFYRMRAAFAGKPLSPVEVIDFPVIGKSSVTPELEFYFAEVLRADGNRDRFILVEQGGEFKIDWEASVAYCDVEWEKFLSSELPEPMDFRVYMSPSDYYVEYAEKDYLCVRLRYPGSKELAYAYCHRKHPRAKALYDLCITGPDRPAVLKLQMEHPRRDNQPAELLLVDLVSKTWLIP